MEMPEFLRLFPMRGPTIMWLFGAGTSVSAGIPTAGDMIWDFKRRLYCSQSRIRIQSCPSLGESAFRSMLNRYFEEQGDAPPAGSIEEYSWYFQQTYSEERERRQYIDQMVANRRPSQGHLAFASLAKLSKVRTVLTTNFDRIVEDAFASVLGGTGVYSVASLDNPHVLDDVQADSERPLLIKLHGDFQSRRIKNTADELSGQDALLRQRFSILCGIRGLAVVGYSGRDDSIMQTIEDSLTQFGKAAFPAGLFWFSRPGSAPLDRVINVISAAQKLGISAHLIEVETFDELMRDLFTLVDDVPSEISHMLDDHQRRVRDVEVPAPGQRDSWPVVRLNAVPVKTWPSICHRVECEIGGTKEVRNAVENAQVDVVAVRSRQGVLCFGSDNDVRQAFSDFNVSRVEVHPIDAGRLMNETTELGLLNDALLRGLIRDRPLRAIPTRRGWMIFVDPDQLQDSRLQKFRALRGGCTGLLRTSRIRWAEAAHVRLHHKLSQMWLIFQPTFWIDFPVKAEPDDGNVEPADEDDTATSEIREFIRERHASRYNRDMNLVFDAWSSMLGSMTRNEDSKIRALSVTDGLDAVFTISGTTAFSRRWRQRRHVHD